VINRIAGLEAMGRLTGVMDDRGKYIYVSNEEMAAVAQFIQTSGRVSIANLAAKSNEFVDLSGPQAAELVRPQLPHFPERERALFRNAHRLLLATVRC